MDQRMNFPSTANSWTRASNTAGSSNGLQGCSSAFMALDLKHTSVNLQELGFGRNPHFSTSNSRTGTVSQSTTSSVGIWYSSPSDSDHDSWLRARRESSGSSADSGIARSFSGPGSWDEQHARAADLERAGIHPFGKISRPSPVDQTVGSDLLKGLRISSSHQTESPAYSSPSSTSPAVSTSSYDSSKVMFPLNPIASPFVPAPKSWAAIAGAPSKGTKGAVSAAAGGRFTPAAPFVAVGISIDKPDKASRPANWSAMQSTAAVGHKRDPNPVTPPKTKLESNSFVPAFIQAQQERNLKVKPDSTASSSGWMLMDGSGRTAPVASPTKSPEAGGERLDKTVKSTKPSVESVIQRLRRENTFNNPDLKALSLEKARFFVMKPLSERDVVDSVVRGEWSSTVYGGELLDEVYQAHHGIGPVYLLFSVNGSGHFCGMARMTSRVKHNADIWKAQHSSGKLSVNWIFVKDVPNSVLRHINIDARSTKPVTNCRDATEISPTEAQKVVKALQSYTSTGNVLESHVKASKDRRNVKRTAPAAAKK